MVISFCGKNVINQFKMLFGVCHLLITEMLLQRTCPSARSRPYLGMSDHAHAHNCLDFFCLFLDDKYQFQTHIKMRKKLVKSCDGSKNHSLVCLR
jgi:hypothetical protein